MRKVVFLLLVVLFCYSSTLTQVVPLGGTRVVSRDAGFEITFPAGFLIPRRDIQRDKTITFATADSGGTCVVAYNTIKTVPLKDLTVKSILEETLSNYLRNDTKIVSSTDVWLGPFRGKSVKFKDVRDTATFYNRFDCYVYGNIILQIAFIGNFELEVEKESITSFFNSLSLIDRRLEKKELKYIAEDNEYSIFLPLGYNKQNKNILKPDSNFSEIPSPFLYPIKPLKGAITLSTKTYPDELFKDKNSYQVLEEAMIGAFDLQKIGLLSRQFLYRDEYTGLSFTGVTQNEKTPMYIRYEYYLKEHKLFQVGYVCYSMDELNSEEVLAYFRSFEIKK
jgi:hypothetical protein